MVKKDWTGVPKLGGWEGLKFPTTMGNKGDYKREREFFVLTKKNH